MKQKNKSIILNTVGIYFLILGIIAILRSIQNQAPYQLLYACYIGLILMGIGILTRKSYLILSQVYILAIPLLVWNIDFFYRLIIGSSLWGTTNYFFLNLSNFIDSFVSLQHLYSVPVALYAINLIGMERKDAWKMSIVQATLTFLIIISFSPSELNINCVFNNCFTLDFWLPYTLSWFIVSFLMIGLSAKIINYFLIKNKDLNNNKISS